jgi:hypothetical protein
MKHSKCFGFPRGGDESASHVPNTRKVRHTRRDLMKTRGKRELQWRLSVSCAGHLLFLFFLKQDEKKKKRKMQRTGLIHGPLFFFFFN